MSDANIRVVLDASAIVAFVQESFAVGEVIAEVSDEEQCFVGLPSLSLADASISIGDHQRIRFLVNHPATRVVADDPDEWPGFVDALATVGRPEAAQASVIALATGGWVMTRWPKLYGDADGEGPVIPL